MWFPTELKVRRKITELLDAFSSIDRRIEKYEDTHRVVNGMFGPAPELMEMRAVHDELSSALMEAQLAMNFGQLTYKEVAPQLSGVANAVRKLNQVLDETDRYAEAGRKTFRNRTGI